MHCKFAIIKNKSVILTPASIYTQPFGSCLLVALSVLHAYMTWNPIKHGRLVTNIGSTITE
jgi:hypothetical protein